jgi:hypothetical protein
MTQGYGFGLNGVEFLVLGEAGFWGIPREKGQPDLYPELWLSTSNPGPKEISRTIYPTDVLDKIALGVEKKAIAIFDSRDKALAYLESIRKNKTMSLPAYDRAKRILVCSEPIAAMEKIPQRDVLIQLRKDGETPKDFASLYEIALELENNGKKRQDIIDYLNQKIQELPLSLLMSKRKASLRDVLYGILKSGSGEIVSREGVSVALEVGDDIEGEDNGSADRCERSSTA